MFKSLRAWLGLPGRFYMYGSLGILLFASIVIATQLTDRRGFANGDLHQDVMARWGAPLRQVAPSVRYVESGSVFNTLHPLALSEQQVELDTVMNYRKRGLVYFSGFDFEFRGAYAIENPEPHPIDVVFVFPVQFAAQSMLSNLAFQVNGEREAIPLDETARRLTWTGRLEPAATVHFAISFGGRGLDQFVYLLDPELPVENFALEVSIRGGENFDYPLGAFPASQVDRDEDGLRLRWDFASVKAGFVTGVVLPSEQSFDASLYTMIRRAAIPFLLFMAGVIALALHAGVSIGRWETYFASAIYSFFYVLLPYLAAYMNFYAAYGLAVISVGSLVVDFLRRLLGSRFIPALAGLWLALLVLPTTAILCAPHTGLIYTLEILAGLCVASLLMVRPEVRRVLESLDPRPKEVPHAS